MTEQEKQKLQTKLVAACCRLQKVEDDKKESNAAFRDEIKETKRRIEALSVAINAGEFTPLHDVLDEHELADIMRAE